MLFTINLIHKFTRDLGSVNLSPICPLQSPIALVLTPHHKRALDWTVHYCVCGVYSAVSIASTSASASMVWCVWMGP